MFDVKGITQAKSLQHALDLLHTDPEAVVIAGGSDVLVQIREGKLAGKRLVSIQGLAELSGIARHADGAINIGPLSTFAQVSGSPVVQAYIPTLGYACDQAGGPQLRNIGTIGGNICNGVCSADSAPALLTLNAMLEITGPGGTRYLPHRNFYLGPGRVTLEPGELLTAIRIDTADYEGYYGHYIKFAQRNALDIATLGCAVHLRLAGGGRHIEELRLAYGVAAPTPVRCPAAEALAKGAEASAETLEAVAASALAEVTPRNSWRASKALREQLVVQLALRATAQALRKAGAEGEDWRRYLYEYPGPEQAAPGNAANIPLGGA